MQTHQAEQGPAKKWLMFHAGAHRLSSCRTTLVGMLASDNASLVRSTLLWTEYVAGIRAAKFCPICGGYAPWTPRLAESLYYECVPIIVDEHWLLPFHNLLNYSSFSLRVNIERLGSIRQIALSADHDVLLQGVRSAKAAFQYHLRSYHGRDMLPLPISSDPAFN